MGERVLEVLPLSFTIALPERNAVEGREVVKELRQPVPVVSTQLGAMDVTLKAMGFAREDKAEERSLVLAEAFHRGGERKERGRMQRIEMLRGVEKHGGWIASL